MSVSESRQTLNWARGSAYEPYVGRWSRLVAREFLEWLALPKGRRWLDVGCGTGALSQTILDLAAPQQLQAVDASAGYVNHARTQVGGGPAHFVTGSATALPYEANHFDVVVSGLVLNFIPEQARALAEMVRVTKPSGTIAAYVWDYAGEMQLMRHFWDAAVSLNSAALELDEGKCFPICQPEPLQALFQGAGLGALAARAIEVPTIFKDFDDYWTPFLGGQGPAPGYAMSLGEAERTELRELVRKRLPFAPDGSIRLHARAWAIRGQR